MTHELVPRAVLSSPEAARRRVALIVAAASGAAGLAGLWMRFEHGLHIRLVLAVTSAIFGWLVMRIAFDAKDRAGAVGRALGCSVLFGMVSTIGPSIVICAHDTGPFILYLIFGGVFGGMVGFAYGLVICIAAAVTWNHLAAGTHDGADCALRAAGLWALVPALLIVFVVVVYDVAHHVGDWASAKDIAAQAVAVPLGVVAMAIAFAVALHSILSASRRLARRARWVIELGADPRWGIRPIGPHDDVANLPRFRDGSAVLEYRHGNAVYRTAATGAAVALL